MKKILEKVMSARKPKPDIEFSRIDSRIKNLANRKKFDNKKIYLFGVSINTRNVIQVLRKYGLETVNILDNDKTKQNSHCARVEVIAIDQVENILDDNNVYIVYSAYWREMIAQLKSKNVNHRNIYVLWQNKPLWKHFLTAAYGGKIYNRLVKEYGNIRVFLCPYTGTGDIYLIGCFWNQYIQQNGIKNYIFVVVNGACKKVAMMFGIKNIELLPSKDYGSYLLQYYLFYPDKVNIVTLNDSWFRLHTNPIEWFRGYKGLNFMVMFRKYVFNLPDNSKPKHPIFGNVDEELMLLFEKYQLISGKTVILSPYSNTLADLADKFWENLAATLKQMGFIVCTNSSGESEPAVLDTIPVFFPLNIAPQFVSKAGYFVGVRSGFCDVISAAKAKKIILYDAEERFYNSSSFEYFSLERMGLCDDAVEIEFQRKDIKLVDTILSKLI